jgi:hypothetical protein
MSSVDYTPVILAQITDLQMRITNQEALISALKNEVERLTGNSINVKLGASIANNTIKTSIPLTARQPPLPPSSNDYSGNARVARGPPLNGERGNMRRQQRVSTPDNTRYERDNRHERDNTRYERDNRHERDNTRYERDNNKYDQKTNMSLSDVLTPGETVTIKVTNGKNDDGSSTYATAVATFDGNALNITECELVGSLVGMSSSKPGEILYKFINELKEGGHITRTFSIPPWRLCYVVRNGKHFTLEELRSKA